MKIGIFGGTFNPVHKSHERIAKSAIENLNLDKLIILPSGNPPHKKGKEILPIELRLEMCKIAFTHSKMEVSDFEVNKKTKSYTFETLEHFSNAGDELFLIIGGDSLRDINSWKNPEQIFSLATVVAFGRDSEKYCDGVKGQKILCFEKELENISSTEIRIKREYGEDVSSLVSKDILDFMNEFELYNRFLSLTQKIRPRMTEERYIHTMNTTICAMELRKFTDLKYKKVFKATALHDIAKCEPSFDKYKKQLKKEGVFIPKAVIHAFVGAYIAEEEFEIKSKKVLNAIKYHTTAREKMTELDKIVYVADCIEKGRNYDGVEELRQKAKQGLDEVFLACLMSSFSNIANKEACSLTLDALEYYKN